MPRIPRKSFDTSFFHIITQGINKEFIFKKDEYIEKYIHLINKYKEEYNISVLAYCIMHNHAHLLLYVNEISEMTKFMHKINAIYAHYYNQKEERVGVVFRNRYESEPIFNEKYLAQCIKYIHMNPVKAGIVAKCSEYKHSSYIEYDLNLGAVPNTILVEIFGKDYLKWINDANEEAVFKDAETSINSAIKDEIKEFKNKNSEKFNEILKSKENTIELMTFLKNKYKITYTEMSSIMGVTKNQLDYFKKVQKKRVPRCENSANETRPQCGKIPQTKRVPNAENDRRKNGEEL